jgi:four helix bundle protein
MTSDELSRRLWQFAARVGKVVDALPDTRLGRHVAGQLVRCGTSSPPNYEEGCAAESRADFVHKLGIALKELNETRGWLHFIIISHLIPENRITSLRSECRELSKILGRSIVTAKSKGRGRNPPPPD